MNSLSSSTSVVDITLAALVNDYNNKNDSAVITSSNDDDDEDDGWTVMLKQLREYRIMNGNCNISQRNKDNPKLGIWVRNQRTHYKGLQTGKGPKIKPERIIKLERLGFSWNLKQAPRQQTISQSNKCNVEIVKSVQKISNRKTRGGKKKPGAVKTVVNYGSSSNNNNDKENDNYKNSSTSSSSNNDISSSSSKVKEDVTTPATFTAVAVAVVPSPSLTTSMSIDTASSSDPSSILNGSTITTTPTPTSVGGAANNKNKRKRPIPSPTASLQDATSMDTLGDNDNNEDDQEQEQEQSLLSRIGKDGEPLSDKKLRRLEKNRLSARECRRRKREATESMQRQINILEGENLRLRLQLQVRRNTV